MTDYNFAGIALKSLPGEGDIIQFVNGEWVRRQPIKQKIQRITASLVISSGDVVIDLNVAPRAMLTLDVNITGTLIVIAPSLELDEVQHVSVLVQQGSGGQTIAAYSSNILWPAGGTAPTLSTAAAAVDILAGIADRLTNVIRMVPSLGFTA